MTGDLILLLIFIGLGVLIGQNWRNDSEREYKKRLLREIDLQLKEELIVEKNLNDSLKTDIAELKRKIRKLEMENNRGNQ